MKVIAFMGQKGGTGKTTLAVHTAVLASQEDPRVVLIDTDPQQSSTTWGGSRQAESPIVATAAASQLDEVLAAARSEDVQMAFVDSAPHAAPSASDVARLADFVVIPTRASALEPNTPSLR